MKILDRYIAKTLLFYTLGVMVIWAGVYALFNFINEVDLIGRQDYTLLSAIIYVVADLPSVIYAHSSVIILLGCLLGLGHLATTAQLIVVRSGGISIMKIAQKVVIAALLFMLITILLGEFVAPVTTKYAELYRSKALGRNISTASQQGFWLKDGNAIINVKKNFDGSVFKKITLMRLNKEHQLDAVMYSDKAVFDGNQLNFEETTRHQLKQTGKFTDIQSKDYQQYNAKVSFNQSLINNLKKEPQMLSMIALYKHISFLSSNNLTSEDFATELYKRTSKPVTLVAMLMLSMLFIFGSLRDSTLGKKIFLGMVVSLLFELSSRIGGVVSLRFNYDPFFGAFAPALVVLMIAFFLLRKKSLEI
ncbi:Permease YjgP/YjgQ family protein [Bathymodiolus thermophilus thioautotrophic gill symbiont]|uniref:Permease YjgP/YjgQ family protein n=1 Tax=Bathymodiolus thermophilus thioautotrophic gill symbiont TaxID=2360 RepID=A0A3G3ILC4_9GAMM|nr:LPS export ABC transporter permease LptG [Bathymodiolus thermophilus thioautotrophic gill symbiont]AYQ56633.1 Permease YjgP/YjgQ family protein [Bathymodiolus thermophilus thioautotrophic gill symbiont]